MDNDQSQVSQIDLQILLDTHHNYDLKEEKIISVAMEILRALDLEDYELSLVIVTNERIRELNKDFRGKDKATDVLSFPQIEWEKPLCVGEKRDDLKPSFADKTLGFRSSLFSPTQRGKKS